MLLARGHRRIGNASFRYAHVYTGAGWFQIVECDGIVCDTRIIPPASSRERAIVCLELFVRGEVETFGVLEGRFGGETALALRHRDYEGASGERTFAFRAAGPIAIVEWHLTKDAVSDLGALPRVVELDAAAWAAASRAATLSQNDDASLAASLRELVARLADRGLLTEKGAADALRPPAAPIRKLWGALRGSIEHLALAVTAGDLGAASDLSTTQVERAFRAWATTFALAGPGIRNVAHNLRLKTAVLFLSADDATVASVAEATGYGSADAMARAFRDAGVEPPSLVQRRLRETR